MKHLYQIKRLLSEEGLIYEGMAKLQEEQLCITDPDHGSTLHINPKCFSRKKLRKKIKEMRRTFNV